MPALSASAIPSTTGMTSFKAVGAGTELKSVTTDGAATLGGNVSTADGQSYGGAVTLGANVVAASSGNGAIEFKSTVDGSAAGTRSLTVTTGGDTTFTQAVGGTNELNVLTVNGGGEAWNKLKSFAKKITPVALAVSFIEGVIDGVKSEMPESAEN